MSTLASLGKEAAIQGGLALATDGGSLLEDVGFGSEKLLAKHFADHGAEFGASTASQYLGAARRFFGGEAETATRGADKLFYREASNEFGVLAADGKTIRTFFKPTEGRAYFDRIVSNLKP